MTLDSNINSGEMTAISSKDWQSSDSKRQAIIDSATRLFLTQGFRQVSMDRIATAAPVSKATLYHYFDGKNTLLAEVISQLCGSVQETLSQAEMEENHVELNLKNIAKSFVDLIFTEEALGLYRLMIAESRDFPGLGILVYQSSARKILPQLENYLQQLNATGCYHIENPVFAADAFLSLLKGDWHFQCLLGIKPRPSEAEKQTLINQAVDFYLRGILHAEA